MQAASESVSAFVGNLQHLAATCSFGTHLNEAIRDHFICGLHSETIQKKLLMAEYSFDKALKIALSIEIAEQDICKLSHFTTQSVNKFSEWAKQPKQETSSK